MKALSIVLLALTIGSHAFADDRNDRREHEDHEGQERRYEERHQASAEERQKKTWGFTWELVGIDGSGIGGVASMGLGVNLFLTPDSLVGVEFSNGQSSNKGYSWVATLIDDAFGYTSFQNVRTLSLYYKHFLGNSFYVRGALSDSELESTEDYKSDLFGTSSNRRLKMNLTSLDVGIGNQWQWQTFTIGCDWIGARFPIGSSVTDSYQSDPTTWGSDEKNEKNAVSQSTQFYLTHFYLGWSF